jgi:hypothetical protein
MRPHSQPSERVPAADRPVRSREQLKPNCVTGHPGLALRLVISTRMRDWGATCRQDVLNLRSADPTSASAATNAPWPSTPARSRHVRPADQARRAMVVRYRSVSTTPRRKAPVIVPQGSTNVTLTCWRCCCAS